MIMAYSSPHENNRERVVGASVTSVRGFAGTRAKTSRFCKQTTEEDTTQAKPEKYMCAQRDLSVMA